MRGLLALTVSFVLLQNATSQNTDTDWTECTGSCGNGLRSRQRCLMKIFCTTITEVCIPPGCGTEPCDFVTCSNGKKCENFGTSFRCVCKQGFVKYGEDCIAGREDHHLCSDNRHLCGSFWNLRYFCKRTCGEWGNGVWMDWNTWSECSVSRGNGEQERYRACTGGHGSCIGIYRDTRQCNNDRKTQPCDKKPCLNGGLCITVGDSYSCKCQHGYGGEKCGEDNNSKKIKPCKNGGTRASSANKCDCPSRHIGEFCEESRDEVETIVKEFMKTVAAASSVTTKIDTDEKVNGENEVHEENENCEDNYADSTGNDRRSASGRPCRKERRKRQIDQPANSIKKRDALFVIDESGSVGPTHFRELLNLTLAIVKSFCKDIEIGENKTRVAVQTFDWKTHPHIDFKDFFGKEEFFHKLQGISYSQNTSGFTCLFDSLKYAKDEMFRVSRGARVGAEAIDKVVYLISDGCPYCHPFDEKRQQLKAIGNDFKQQRIQIVIFLIGSHSGDCVQQMNDLISLTKCVQLINVKTWDGVKLAIDQISNATCLTDGTTSQGCD